MTVTSSGGFRFTVQGAHAEAARGQDAGRPDAIFSDVLEGRSRETERRRLVEVDLLGPLAASIELSRRMQDKFAPIDLALSRFEPMAEEASLVKPSADVEAVAADEDERDLLESFLVESSDDGLAGLVESFRRSVVAADASSA